jgi:hypothetical protein
MGEKPAMTAPRNALEEIDKIQANVEGMFAAYAVMQEGVKSIAEEILVRIKSRPDPAAEMTGAEVELIALASRLIDLIATARVEIERAGNRD